MRYTSVAIDGPSGAGKSTLARRLAGELGFLYVDTGAIYRTLALHVYRTGVPPEDGEQVVEALSAIRISMSHGEGGQRMFLNGEDVSEAIREHHISKYASLVSTIPAVREFLLETQRQFARENNVIMDGRDIGTVVLPQADVKIYLTASAEARAARRCLELRARGEPVDPAQILRDVIERDERDIRRETAPLCKAEGAAELDTTGIDLEESYRRLRQLTVERLGLEGAI